jgi:hypothetical protein
MLVTRFMQQPDPLCPEFPKHAGKTGNIAARLNLFVDSLSWSGLHVWP